MFKLLPLLTIVGAGVVAASPLSPYNGIPHGPPSAYHPHASATPTPTSSATASATPTKCDFKAENTPWKITELSIFDADNAYERHVSFDFEDVNDRLQINTTCIRTLKAGSNETLIKDNMYYPCTNAEVRFKFNGNTLGVEREYTDECVGKPPYDGVLVFGHSDVQWTNSTGDHGNWSKSQDLDIPITEMA